MKRKYTEKQLQAIVNGEYMPRERALAQQCLNFREQLKHIYNCMMAEDFDRIAPDDIKKLIKK